MTEGEDENPKSALKELAATYNYQTDSDKNGKSATFASPQKLYQTDHFNFSSKKFVKTDSRKLLDEPEKTFKQCKSMKTIPSFDRDE
jgi:hypothetical protein